ncbi:DUF523 domain-containing protein [Romboutsia sp.]|uniref:DUF523 domain-containing protein n=1 Tax=Romboutsia sp. TaxID=1965302 RepID=UPI003F2BD890
MILVSACLLGINCKYNGEHNKSDKVIEYLKDKEYIIVCPEQLGGLSTPRRPSEITSVDGYEVINGNSNVISNEGIDVTENFKKGAKESLKIANLYQCTEAILKESSPSCGSNYIYDGTFSGNKIPGVGVTTALLRLNNIKVISEKEI